MADERTPQEKEDDLIAAMQAAVDRTNPSLVEPSMSKRAPVFTQARQAYTQYGAVPLQNQVVNPKLLEPLPPGTPLEPLPPGTPLEPLPPGTSVANATMPQPSGYVIPERSYSRIEQDNNFVEQPYEALRSFDTTFELAPEAPAAPKYLPAEAPDLGYGGGKTPPVVPELQEETPLQSNGVTAAQVGMDPRYAQGVEDRRKTLGDLQKVFSEGEQPIQVEEKKYTDRMGKYATDLGNLQDTRAKLDTARGVERQIESADMARTAMQFDANRVFSDVASSPLGTAGLALASGIVQGLNGYAGLDKPDAILASIKEAATRDVGNQVKMSEAGEKSRLGSKNAYDEAIKSGADKQEAVRLAAMASLDQIGKGLDFIKARQVRAKDRADLEIASGALKSEVGKEFTNLAIKRAEISLQAAIANMTNSTHLQVAAATARREFRKLDYETQEKARTYVGAYMLDNDKGGAVQKNLTNAQQFYTELTKGIKSGAKLEDLVAQDWLATLSRKLTESGTRADKDVSAIQATFNLQAAEAMKAEWSPEKKAVMSIVQRMYADRLREQLGRSQTAPELATQALVTDMKDPDSVMRFVRNSVNEAAKKYQNQVDIAPQAYKPVWDAALGGDIRLAYALEREVFSAPKNATVVRK